MIILDIYIYIYIYMLYVYIYIRLRIFYNIKKKGIASFYWIRGFEGYCVVARNGTNIVRNTVVKSVKRPRKCYSNLRGNL